MDWNCAPTCIGSLPFNDPARAVDLVLEELKEVPYWPQLPELGFHENMYAQYSTHLPGILIDGGAKRITVDLKDYDPEGFYTAVVGEDLDYFAYPHDAFRGMYEFLDRPIPKGIKAIKGQITGPISCGLQVFDQNGKSAIYDETYGEIIRKNLNMCARWQERELKERASNVIMFLDEPSLSLVGTPFAPIVTDKVVEWIDEVLEGLNCIKGIHCCGNTDWPMVLSTDIDLLSFDAYSYAFSVALYPKELKAFLDRGGVLSWGIVPNLDSRLAEESVTTLLDRFEKGLDDLVAKGLDRGTILRQSLLTPQCGLGGLDEEWTARALHTLNGLSMAVRERHRLEG
jgi:methionine synthase II (cobalamin-independent)